MWWLVVVGGSMSRMWAMPASESAQPEVRAWIQSVRPMPLWFMILALVLYFVLNYLVNIVATPAKLLPSLPAATGHVIAPTFLNYVPLFIIMGLLLVLIGRLRCNDLCLIRRRLLPAIAWVVGSWIVAQLFLLLVHLGDVSIDPAWNGRVVAKISDLITGQLLGNALYEDVFWRAFLISQLVLLLVRRMKWKFGTALTWAILVSSVLFALSHLPHDFAHGFSTSQIIYGQLGRLAAGLVLAGLFLLSNNIFIAIGIHGLVNDPLVLFESSNSELVQVFFVFAPLLVLAILAIRRRRASR